MAARQDGHGAAGFVVHDMFVAAPAGVVHAVEAACHAGIRLSQAAGVKTVAAVRQDAAGFNGELRQDDVCGVAAAVGERVAARFNSGVLFPVSNTREVECRLDGELLARFEFVRPFGAHLNDLAAQFVTDDDGIFCAVVRHALVIAALDRCFVRGHADAVGYDAGQNLTRPDGGQLVFVQTQVVFPVQSQRFRFQRLVYTPFLFTIMLISFWFTCIVKQKTHDVND